GWPNTPWRSCCPTRGWRRPWPRTCGRGSPCGDGTARPGDNVGPRPRAAAPPELPRVECRASAEVPLTPVAALLGASLTTGVPPLEEPAPKDCSKFLDRCLQDFLQRQTASAGKRGIDRSERWDVHPAEG